MATQPQTQEPAKPKLQHKHPNNEHYLFTCKACRDADAQRSKLDVRALSDDDLVRTTFLVPETDYDNRVCRAYIALKYPDAVYVESKLNTAQFGGWADGEQIVVVRRDTHPKPGGPGSRREKDVEDRWQYIPIEPETYINEVVESAPVDVKTTMVVTKADRFTKAELNTKPLIARLSELMPLPYRIDLPRDDNDSVLYFVHA
jgi:hypothetical protein